jgi:hypothetical protein
MMWGELRNDVGRTEQTGKKRLNMLGRIEYKWGEMGWGELVLG